MGWDMAPKILEDPLNLSQVRGEGQIMPTTLLLAFRICRPSYSPEYHIKIEQSVKDRQIMFFLKHELVIFDLIL